MNVISLGTHILDVLVRPASEISPEQGKVLVDLIAPGDHGDCDLADAFAS